MNVRNVIASQVSHLFTADDGDAADGLLMPTKRGRGARKSGDEEDLCMEIADELDVDEDVENDTQDDQVERFDPELDGESESSSESIDIAEMSGAERSNPEDLAAYRQLRASTAAAAATLDSKGGEAKQKRRRRERVNFGINAILDKIDMPLYGEDDWLWNRDAAHTVYDEDARTRQLILAHTITNSQPTPPARGMRRRFQPPTSLREVVFEQWMRWTTTKLYTTNVVATFHLGAPVYLFYILQRIAGVCFNPRCFAAAKLRCEKGTHLIFSAGSVVCPGANSVQMARIAAYDCAMLLTQIGIQAEVSKFTVQNVVSTADAGFRIDLFDLATAYPINAHYNPDCFPGLMFRLSTMQLVIIAFESGKCIITGVSTREQSLFAWRYFHSRVLWEFEMHTTAFHESDADYRRYHRQQTSMIDTMCESVRDITTAHIATLLDREGTQGETLHNIYQGKSFFEQLIDMTPHIGLTAAAAAAEQEKVAPLDLLEWFQLMKDKLPPPTTAAVPLDDKADNNDDSDDGEHRSV